jgi:hypothetical protein
MKKINQNFQKIIQILTLKNNRSGNGDCTTFKFKYMLAFKQYTNEGNFGDPMRSQVIIGK